MKWASLLLFTQGIFTNSPTFAEPLVPARPRYEKVAPLSFTHECTWLLRSLFDQSPRTLYIYYEGDEAGKTVVRGMEKMVGDTFNRNLVPEVIGRKPSYPHIQKRLQTRAEEMTSNAIKQLYKEYGRHYPQTLVQVAANEEKALPITRQQFFLVVDGDPPELQATLRVFNASKKPRNTFGNGGRMSPPTDPRTPAERLIAVQGGATPKLTAFRNSLPDDTEIFELGKYLLKENEKEARVVAKMGLWRDFQLKQLLGSTEKQEYVVHVVEERLIPKYTAEFGFEPLEQILYPNGNKEWILRARGDVLKEHIKRMLQDDFMRRKKSGASN